MTSPAKTLANRRNAQKSTGPRTPWGKGFASQNSLKHGLSVRQAVIGSKDRAEFELHRERCPRELPLGRMTIKDFSNDRVLERVLMYERRLEHSLYRTLI